MVKNNQIRQMVIVCDESVKKGLNYSYFYGGAMVKEADYEMMSQFLDIIKKHIGLNEMKRIKISEKNYKDYIFVLKAFFNIVRAGNVVVRIMFSPNNQLIRLPKKEDESYSKLYYTFIKNAFGLFYTKFDIKLRLLFDELPDQKRVNDKFKAYLISNLKHSNKKNNKVITGRNFVEEVDSKKHPILQCIDVITGVIENELNLKPGEVLSKRKAAKHKVYKYIMDEVSQIHDNFVVTETTRPIYSLSGFYDPYKHFVYKKKVPDAPT